MTELGGVASCTMKVCEATESIMINRTGISVVIDMRQYILKQKLLH